MARLFISQDQMDRWTHDGKVRLEDDVMNLPAFGRSFRLRSAVLFTKIVEGADERQLLGRVKTTEQIAALAGEHYGTSVLFGEVGYECEEGFVGVPVDPQQGTGASGLIRLGTS